MTQTMLEGRSRSGMFETYVFGGVLGNRLPFLRSVMLVSTMSRDCTQVCDEGEAGEELHKIKIKCTCQPAVPLSQ